MQVVGVDTTPNCAYIRTGAWEVSFYSIVRGCAMNDFWIAWIGFYFDQYYKKGRRIAVTHDPPTIKR